MKKEKSIWFLESRHDNRWGGKGSRGFKIVTMGRLEFNQVHLYILNNTKEVVPYIASHKEFFKVNQLKLIKK